MAGDSFTRGWKSTFATVFFISLSAIAVKEMGGTISSISETIETLMKTLKFPDHDQTLLETYTGISSIDYLLRHLVVAFLPGVAGWSASTQVHQIYFLVSFFPVVSILTIEGVRKGNAPAFLSWTLVWGTLYQTIGGATVTPLWYILFFRNSAKKSSWSPASRSIDTPYAKVLLPALLLGYLLPTVAMYIPFPDPGFKIHQVLIALWQPFPLFVSLLLAIISSFVGKQETAPKINQSQSNLKYLHRVYITNFAVCAIVHIVTIVLCISQKVPQVSFVHSLLRVPASERLTFTGSLHYGAQIDCLIILTAALAAAWGVMWDLKHFGNAEISTGEIAIQMTISTILFGPGATVAGVWLLREHMMSDKGVKRA